MLPKKELNGMEAAKEEKVKARKTDDIIWIHTPKCSECEEYNTVLKKCSLEVCRYPSKR